MVRGPLPRFASLFVVLALVACGRHHPTKAGSTTTTGPTTTTAAVPSVGLRPTTGPVGTTFTLTASHFRAGETLRFEIRMPDGKIFKGPFHQVPGSGTVVAPYKTTADNPPGPYTVRAATDKGVSAEGTFTLTSPTPGVSGTSPSSGSSTTTRPITTTARH